MNLQKIVEEMKKWNGLKTYSEGYQIGYVEALDDLLEEVSKLKLNKTFHEQIEGLTRYLDKGWDKDGWCGVQTDPNGDFLFREDVLKLSKFEDDNAFCKEELTKLNELADQDKCDGHCDDHPPYKTCPECMAINAINEAAEILRNTLFRLEKDKDVIKKGVKNA